MSMNALSVLFPYKYEGMWVFDDPAVGLQREPFVLGIDEYVMSEAFPLRDKIALTIPREGHTASIDRNALDQSHAAFVPHPGGE